jgi:hypothetical protein
VKYGSDAYIQLSLSAPTGTNKLECYVEYVREGRVRRTNILVSSVTGM